MNVESLDLARDKHRTRNAEPPFSRGQACPCWSRDLSIIIQYSIFGVLFFCVARAWGQSSKNQPQIGYLYPAGGQQGTVFQITAGGQFLGGVSDVYVSGQGVHAKVVKYIRPLRNLQREQRQFLQKRLKEVQEKRLAELPMKGLSRSTSARGAPRQGASARQSASRRQGASRSTVAKRAADKAKAEAAAAKAQAAAKQEDAAKAEEVKLPDHPLLYDLDDKSLRELAHVTSILFFPRAKQQTNRQLSEMVLIEITIDSDVPPGNRELRLGTRTGLTNPMVFQVGLFPEIRELEPNNRQAYPDLPNLSKARSIPKDKPLDLPVLLNGQIMPGDIDRFRFSARQGQQLVIEAQARSLIPYLADAVPGWFQATLALYDANGREVAFADDYHFNPDPVLFYRIPRSGEYELEIRDSIYRGREDFVYRIAVGEQPSITQIAYHEGKQLSNSILYTVDALPDCTESESNDTIKSAQRIDLPKIINGRIDRPGDVDIFQFEGSAGDEVVAEVYGRRLNSPLDSLLRLTDASGSVLEWNDDYVLKDGHLHTNMMGLATHHADSYLLAELPKNGAYYVHLADSQRHGGEAYGYRLRIATPQGDFSLRVMPSSISVRTGGIVPVWVHALRKDGFDGEIEVALKDAPAGFELDGARIPAGRDRIRVTLKAPATAPDRPVALQLEGRARIGGQTLSRPAVPADDVMQAFLYRHLVPAQEFLVSVQKARWGMPPVELTSDSPVRIPAGGSAQVRVKTRRSASVKQMRLELNEPPEGLTLHDVTVTPEGLAFQLKADKDVLQGGFADNLIVEAFRVYRPKQKDGKLSNQTRRSSMGIFPAIPIEIVQR